mgnify:CR=1 FL=1
MVVLDANVILRYLLNDNEAMAREAESIIKTEVTMVPIEVIAEVVYVLKGVYSVDGNKIRDANMCDALRELMKDDLEDARKLGESEGEVRGEARGKVMGEVVGEAKIILKMNHSGMSPENIASITGKDLDEINAILEGKVPVIL